jgi:hypothetical protein
MNAHALPKSGRTAPPPRPRPELRVVEARRHAAKVHLWTYIVGNALFWTLWAAVSVSTDDWYWWIVVPFLAWTVVLALHLRHAYRRPR